MDRVQPGAYGRLAVRKDLGGWTQSTPAGSLDVALDQPMVLLTGSMGSGKSSLLAAIRASMGLYGTGKGTPKDGDGWNKRVYADAADNRWRSYTTPDLGRAVSWVPIEYSTDRPKDWPHDIKPRTTPHPGVVDIKALGWEGQRSFLFDIRNVDSESAMDATDSDMLSSMTRAARRNAVSHGQSTLSRLRHAIAWSLGLFDMKDVYDLENIDIPNHYGNDMRMADIPTAWAHSIYRTATGRIPGQERPAQRWLFLDEPEVGLDPSALVSHMTLLADRAAQGRIRVFCATQSPLLAYELDHPAIQRVDLDGWAAKYEMAVEAARQAHSSTQAGDDLEADLAARVETLKGVKRRINGTHPLATDQAIGFDRMPEDDDMVFRRRR